jgi:hypothetical protein
MPIQRHEIPTHLNVEDKAFFGLTVRQVMHLTIGLAGGYAVWNQWPDLPAALRLGLAGVGLAQAVALALFRPGGRGLEEWAFVALHYTALPKASVWRPREPERADWRPGAGGWEAWTPTLAWEEERP